MAWSVFSTLQTCRNKDFFASTTWNVSLYDMAVNLDSERCLDKHSGESEVCVLLMAQGLFILLLADTGEAFSAQETTSRMQNTRRWRREAK